MSCNANFQDISDGSITIGSLTSQQLADMFSCLGNDEKLLLEVLATKEFSGDGIGAFTAGADTLITPLTPIVMGKSTGNEVGLTLNYTTSKASFGNDTGLLINKTDINSPGVSALADFQTGGSSKFFVSGGGNVGIGTTTPVSALHVRNNVATLTLDDANNSSTGAGYRPFIDLLANTVSVGSIGFNGGTNLKITAENYNSAAVILETAGTERMRIDSSGNVGIGTASPAYRLTVKSSGDNTFPHSVLASDGAYIFGVKQDSAGGGAVSIRNTSGNEQVFLNTSGDSYFTGGNVGIGTTSPTRALVVKSTTNAIPAATLEGTGSSTAITSGSTLQLANVDATDGNYASIYFADTSTGAAATILGTKITSHVSNYGQFEFWTRGATGFGTRMTIGEDGNVGIGTTSPTTPAGFSAATVLEINGNGSQGGALKLSGSAGDGFSLATASLGLYFRNDTDASTSMLIDNAGNVGIGTTSPTAALQVIGNVHAGAGNTGLNSNFIGNLAGTTNSGAGAVGIGYNAAYQNTGNWLVAIGREAAQNNTGNNVVAAGFESLTSNGGADNTGIGYRAGTYQSGGTTALTTASTSVFLGSTTKGVQAVANQIVIGYAAESIGANSVVLGNSSIATTVLRGNVGIGTTSPGNKFTVNADGGGSAIAYLNNTNVSGYGLLVNSSDTNNARYALKLTSGSGDLMFVGNGGNVGIGTTTPTAALDVRATYAALNGGLSKAMFNIVSTNTAAADVGGTLQFSGSSGQASSPYGFAAIKGAKESGGTYNGYLAFSTVPAGSGISERMRIDSTGNVGIGTTTPDGPLHVVKGAEVVGTSSSTAVAVVEGDSASAVDLCIYSPNTAQGRLMFGDPEDNDVGKISYYHANNYMYIATNAGATALTLGAVGNVGIGTNTPSTSAALDITSTTQAFLPPRMTTTQKNAVASPTAGMVVYDSTLSKLAVYTGAAWEAVTSVV